MSEAKVFINRSGSTLFWMSSTGIDHTSPVRVGMVQVGRP